VGIDRVVPVSGNLAVRGQQFWLGPDRAGTPVTLWADTTVVHLFLRGQRLKSLASRLSADDLRRLLADGGRPAGPPPIPSFINTGPGLGYVGAIEVERLVNAVGCISVAARSVPIGTPLAGRRVTLRLDGTLLQVIDNNGDAGILLRSLPFPLTTAQLARIRGSRPAGPARARRPSCCKSSVGCPAAARSWPPSNASTSASSTPARPSLSRSTTARSPSSTAPTPCWPSAAPAARRSPDSKPASPKDPGRSSRRSVTHQLRLPRHASTGVRHVAGPVSWLAVKMAIRLLRPIAL
jgi:hypothetical protein